MVQIRIVAFAATSSLAVAALAAPAAPAATPKPKMGFYNCFSGIGSSPMFQYTLRFQSKGRYQHGYGRQGGGVKSPSNGTYKQKGSKITFKGGRMSKTYLRIKSRDGQPQPVLEVYAEGSTISGIECQYRSAT